jgi:hypothetical protein
MNGKKQVSFEQRLAKLILAKLILAKLILAKLILAKTK